MCPSAAVPINRYKPDAANAISPKSQPKFKINIPENSIITPNPFSINVIGYFISTYLHIKNGM